MLGLGKRKIEEPVEDAAAVIRERDRQQARYTAGDLLHYLKAYEFPTAQGETQADAVKAFVRYASNDAGGVERQRLPPRMELANAADTIAQHLTSEDILEGVFDNLRQTQVRGWRSAGKLDRGIALVELFQAKLPDHLVEFLILYLSELEVTSPLSPAALYECAKRLAALRREPGLTKSEHLHFLKRCLRTSADEDTLPLERAFEKYCAVGFPSS